MDLKIGNYLNFMINFPILTAIIHEDLFNYISLFGKKELILYLSSFNVLCSVRFYSLINILYPFINHL